MYENVVIAHLLHQRNALADCCRSETEEEFYRRFATPTSGWFVAFSRLITSRGKRQASVTSAFRQSAPSTVGHSSPRVRSAFCALDCQAGYVSGRK